MKCGSCGKESDGAYCAHCGAPLSGARCDVCEAPLEPAARFCTRCGAPVRDRPSALPWLLTGAALAALIVVLILPSLRGAPELSPFAPMAAAPAAGTPAAGTPPPLTGTPREQADRLFNRIMEENSAGNQERATFFLPMAISAYQQAGELDDDGLYHLSLLQTMAGQAADARATAELILTRSPQHLLGLAAAAQAAVEAGDSAAARTYSRRFLDSFESEQTRALPEYRDHARILPEYRREAEARAGSSVSE
jgi:hypothetical protein